MILSGEIDEIKNRFKSNIFEVGYKSPRELLLDDKQFHLVDSIRKNGERFAKIKIDEDSSSNRLLTHIIQQAEVVSFNEVLPSVNDIFIQKVNETN